MSEKCSRLVQINTRCPDCGDIHYQPIAETVERCSHDGEFWFDREVPMTYRCEKCGKSSEQIEQEKHPKEPVKTAAGPYKVDEKHPFVVNGPYDGAKAALHSDAREARSQEGRLNYAFAEGNAQSAREVEIAKSLLEGSTKHINHLKAEVSRLRGALEKICEVSNSSTYSGYIRADEMAGFAEKALNPPSEREKP